MGGNKIVKRDIAQEFVDKIIEISDKFKEFSTLLKEQFDKDYREGTLRGAEALRKIYHENYSLFQDFSYNAFDLDNNIGSLRTFLLYSQTDYANLKYYVTRNIKCLAFRRANRIKERLEAEKIVLKNRKSILKNINKDRKEEANNE